MGQTEGHAKLGGLDLRKLIFFNNSLNMFIYHDIYKIKEYYSRCTSDTLTDFLATLIRNFSKEYVF